MLLGDLKATLVRVRIFPGSNHAISQFGRVKLKQGTGRFRKTNDNRFDCARYNLQLDISQKGSHAASHQKADQRMQFPTKPKQTQDDCKSTRHYSNEHFHHSEGTCHQIIVQNDGPSSRCKELINLVTCCPVVIPIEANVDWLRYCVSGYVEIQSKWHFIDQRTKRPRVNIFQ